MSEHQQHRTHVRARSEKGQCGLSSSNTANSGHYRSFSLNDLDCTRQPKTPYGKKDHTRSSSSAEALQAAAHTPTYPHIPCWPPIAGTVTPLGLPSFGTAEAQQLRLAPLSRFDRLGQSLQQYFMPAAVEQGVDTNQGVEERVGRSDENDTFHTSRLEGPADMLRRVMGTNRPITFTPGVLKPRRTGLPKGVVRASDLGPLALAEDGSQVRGRFGNRASGHGVGSRAINTHPLAHLRDVNVVRDRIEQSEKAGTREGQIQHSQSASGPPPQSSLTSANSHVDAMTTHTHSPNRPAKANTAVQGSTTMASIDATTARLALESERCAIKALQAQMTENARLRAALAELQSSPQHRTSVPAGDHEMPPGRPEGLTVENNPSQVNPTTTRQLQD